MRIALHLGWMICLDYWESLDSWAGTRSGRAWGCHVTLALWRWSPKRATGKPGQRLFWVKGATHLIPSHGVHPPCGAGRPRLCVLGSCQPSHEMADTVVCISRRASYSKAK